jgi:hypothetical protein
VIRARTAQLFSEARACERGEMCARLSWVAIAAAVTTAAAILLAREAGAAQVLSSTVSVKTLGLQSIAVFHVVFDTVCERWLQFELKHSVDGEGFLLL